MPGVGDLAKFPASALRRVARGILQVEPNSEASDKTGASADGVPFFGIEPVWSAAAGSRQVSLSGPGKVGEGLAGLF